MKSLKERVEKVLSEYEGTKPYVPYYFGQNHEELIKDLHSRNEELEIFFKENGHQLERQSKLIERYREALEKVVKAHSSCICKPDIECSIDKHGCLGDALHNEIIKAKQALNDEEVKDA